jgi:RNA polymerase sigma-70 factor, ECF subfamily
MPGTGRRPRAEPWPWRRGGGVRTFAEPPSGPTLRPFAIVHYTRTEHGQDARLLQRLVEGDEGALDQLLELHWDGLIAYAVAYLRSADAAEDVVQEAFIRLWERRNDWAPGSPARPILFRLVRNLALDERRQARVRARPGSAVLGVPEAPPTADRSVEEQELAAAVAVALRGLSDREREVVVLSRFHDLTRAQIAEVLSLAPQTVSNLLSVGLTRLWRALAPYLDEDRAALLRRRSLRRA